MHLMDICVSFFKNNDILLSLVKTPRGVKIIQTNKHTNKKYHNNNKKTQIKNGLPVMMQKWWDSFRLLLLRLKIIYFSIVMLRNRNVSQILKINLPCHPTNSLLSVQAKKQKLTCKKLLTFLGFMRTNPKIQDIVSTLMSIIDQCQNNTVCPYI